MNKLVFLLLIIASLSTNAQNSPLCVELFRTTNLTSPSAPTIDVRVRFDQLQAQQIEPLFLKIGEGNSAISYLFRESTPQGHTQYSVMKVYKENRFDQVDPQKILERDHNGLREVQDFFMFDRQHSSQLRVVSSEIRTRQDGTRVLVMPFVPGHNLHTYLIETPANNPSRQVAVDLYNQMIAELHRDAQRLGLTDEVTVETIKHFQDRRVDGMTMLRVNGNPSLLIKTDNLIFNPEDNSLTLVDPY